MGHAIESVLARPASVFATRMAGLEFFQWMDEVAVIAEHLVPLGLLCSLFDKITPVAKQWPFVSNRRLQW